MNKPVRLHKQDEVSPMINFEEWLQSHSSIVLIILVIILIILIIGLFGAIMQVFAVNGTMTGTEANAFYYHLEDFI